MKTKVTKTFSQKPADVVRSWYVVDADGQTLGRLATLVADKLVGKSKITFTPHTDGGDFVVVINAAKIKLTGRKEDQKIYYRHSGYPGSMKQRTAGEVRVLKPEFMIVEAVRGMIAKNKLSPLRLGRLHVYGGAEHKHEAQQPKTLEVK